VIRAFDAGGLEEILEIHYDILFYSRRLDM